MSETWTPGPGDIPPWVPLDQVPPTPPAAPFTPPAGRNGTTPYGAKALTDEAAEVAGTAEGGRNSRLNTAALKLGRLVAGGAISSEDEVYNALAAAARSCGLRDTEALRTIRSGLNRGMAEPRSAPERNGQHPTGSVGSTRRSTPIPEPDDSTIINDKYGPGTQLRLGRCQDVLADIADNSVDLIVTDPLYGGNVAPLYNWLGAFAARVLKPGGSLISFASNTREDRDRQLLSSHGLLFHRRLSFNHSEHPQTFTEGPRAGEVFTEKPIFWLVKDHHDQAKSADIPDVITSDYDEAAERKKTHRWAQGEAGVTQFIEQLSEPGQLIVDPFAGTGQWGQIASQLERRWIGADLREDGGTFINTDGLGAPAQPPAAGEPWEAPQPLTVDVPRLPETLPNPIGHIVKAVSTSTQTPPDLGFFTALGAVTAATRGRVTVRLRSDWDEPLTIFAMPVASSGERKSKVRSLIGGPLDSLEAFQRERLRDEHLEAKGRYELKKKQVAAALRKAASDATEASGDAEEKHYLKLAREFGKMVEPCELRLTADDVTPEQLGVEMARQDGALAILSAEGGFLGTIGGRYSDGIPNLDLILKSHSGEPVKVDRISRPSIEIPHPALTLVLVVQPDVLRELTANRTFVRRGLAARFLYALPPSTVGSRSVDAPDLDVHIVNAWENRLSAIFNVEGRRILTLDAEAARRFAAFRTALEPQLLPHTGRLDQIREWGSKLPGAIARIAGIFTLVEDPEATKISDSAMQSAVSLADYLAAHALSAMATAPRNEAAIDLAAWILRNRERFHKMDPPKFSIREAHRGLHGRAWCTGADAIRDAAAALELASWVRLDATAVAVTQRGRPPSETYLVNPDTVGADAGVPLRFVNPVTMNLGKTFLTSTTTDSNDRGPVRSSSGDPSSLLVGSDRIDKSRHSSNRRAATHGPDVTCQICGTTLAGMSTRAQFCSKRCK